MEISLLPESGSESWVEPFTALLHAERDRVREFLAAQQARLEQAEAMLGELLQQRQQTTEKIIVEKNRQIQELKQRLGEPAHDIGTEAADETAIDRALDGDAVVHEERERLRQLQEQWQEKLRQAEVDLSVERAKLARQRAELDKQIRSAADDLPQTSAADHAGQPTRGRWLARLGLTEEDRSHEGQR